MRVREGEPLFQGRRFRVIRAFQLDPDGNEHARDVVRHPGAVTIVPVLDDGRICFIENYRAAVAEHLIELPAGTLEPDEDPAATARRELAEETGYRADRLELLADFYTSPGVLDEKMYLYLATGLAAGEMALEPGEAVRPRLIAGEEALQMAQTGRIHDAKTLVGLFYYHIFRRK